MQDSRENRIIWQQSDGMPVACKEKLKVLNENLLELRQVAQDAFEDALLMGCDEAQVRQVLRALIDSLQTPLVDSHRVSPSED